MSKGQDSAIFQASLRAALLSGLMAALSACGEGGAAFSEHGGGKVPLKPPPARTVPAGDDGSVARTGTDPGTPGDPGAKDDGAEGNEQPPLPTGPRVDVAPTSALFWAWPCEGMGAAGMPAPTIPNATVLKGSGEFAVSAVPGAAIELEVAGLFCKPEAAARDVLFLVDVSSSMRDFLNLGHDPVRDGRCGRMDAVEAGLATLGSDARVAVVTFGGSILTNSGGYIDVASFRSRYLSVDVLCDRGTRTDFHVALLGAETLVRAARPNSAREVFMISDGQPSGTDTGQDDAARIRQMATIATIVVKGDDDILKETIASKDPSGNPLHADVADATGLAAAMTSLATSTLESAVVRYGNAGTAPLAQMDVPVNAADLSFRLAALGLSPEAFPDGLRLEIEAKDTRGVRYGGAGLITWK